MGFCGLRVSMFSVDSSRFFVLEKGNFQGLVVSSEDNGVIGFLCTVNFAIVIRADCE